MSIDSETPGVGTPDGLSDEASEKENAELERMRQAIFRRGEGKLWQLVPKRTLLKCFWLVLVLVSIIWLQRNTGRLAQFFNQSLSPGGANTPSRAVETAR